MDTSRKLALLLTAMLVFVALTASRARAQATIDPGTPDPYPERYDYQVGLYFQSHGNYARAIDEFSAALQLQPTMAAAYSARADSESALEQYSLAIADYTQALALNTSDGMVYAKRAFAFAADGDLPDAQHDFAQFAQAEFDF